MPDHAVTNTPDHRDVGAGDSQQLVTRNFLRLGSGEASARVLAFGATVFLAHRLGAEAFGVVAFAAAVVLYLSRIADAGIDMGIGVREVAASKDRLHEIIPPIITLRVCLAVLVAGVVGPAAYLLLPAPDGTVVALLTLTLLPLAASTRWVHVGLERTSLTALTRVGGELIMLVSVLVFVRDIDDIVRVPLAQFAGDVSAALVLAWALKKMGFAVRLRWRNEVIRPLAKRATPFVGSLLLGLMIYNGDLIFLRVLRDTSIVGYYAAAYALISFLINIGMVYSLAMLPTITRLESNPGAQGQLYGTSIAHVFAIAVPLAVGGVMVAPDLIDLVFGDEFQPAGVVLRILLVSLPATLVGHIPIFSIMSKGREDYVLRVTGSAVILNFTLNAVLIPPLGMIGASLATVTTEMFRLAGASIFARRLGFCLPSVQRVWRPVVATLAMLAVLWWVAAGPLWLRIVLGMISYGVVLASLGGIRRDGRWPELTV